MSTLTNGASDRDASGVGTPASASLAVPRVVPTRHPGRWILAAAVLLLLAELIRSAMTNRAFLWGTYSEYFFSPTRKSVV